MFLLLIAEWLSGGGMTWADAVGEFMYQSVNGMWAKWNILKFS